MADSSFITRGASRRTFLMGTAGLGAAVLLTSCGGPGAGDRGITIVDVAIPTDVQPANLLGIQPGTEPVARLVLETLADVVPGSSDLKPVLAESWSFSADRRELVVTLRDDVTFHTGRALTASDVVFSAKAAQAPDAKAQVGALLADVTSVTATGDHEVTFALSKRVGDSFLDLLWLMRIVDEKTFADFKSGKQVVGTGPFVWKQWRTGSSVKLARNESYWQSGKPVVDEVNLRVVSQPQAMLAAMRSGQSSVAMRMVPRDAKALQGDDNVEVDVYTPFAEAYLGVDVSVKPLDDIRVRQALAWALDRARIAEQVYAGYAEPTSLPFSPAAPGIADIGDTTYGYDPAKARTLIKEAGAAGAKVQLSVLATDPILSGVRDIISFNLQEIGLTPVANAWEAADVPTNLGAGTTGGLWVNWVASGNLSIGTMTKILLPYKAAMNASNMYEPEYKRLVSNCQSGTATDNAALATYVLDQAFHLTVVRAKAPLVVAKNLDGTALDGNGYLILTDAKSA